MKLVITAKCYEERLKYLNLSSLQARTRRVRGDLIQTFIFFNNVDDIIINKDCFFEPALMNITRNSTDKIQIQPFNNNTRKCTYSRRVASLWNKLTPDMKRAPNTNTSNSFKNIIDKDNILMHI